MELCSNCGTEIVEGAAFCPNCGKPLSATVVTNEVTPKQSKRSVGKTLGIVSIATSVIPLVGLIIGIIGLKRSTAYWDKVLNEIGIGLSILFFSIAIGASL